MNDQVESGSTARLIEVLCVKILDVLSYVAILGEDIGHWRRSCRVHDVDPNVLLRRLYHQSRIVYLEMRR